MFYDNLVRICNARGISPSAAIAEAGINKSAGTRWKNGKKPTAANLQKLADYFGVSKEELTGAQRIEVSTGLRPRHIIIDVEPKPQEAHPHEGDELLDAVQGLSAENRQKAQEYIEMLLALQDRS